MMFTKSVVSGCLVFMLAGAAFGAISKEEAEQLGNALTPIGAEKIGNKDGSIPEYTGGLVTGNQKKGPVSRKDPFGAEKPLFSITNKNMAQYSDKLSEGVKALMKKYPTYRMDVYKSHRTVAFPKWVYDNTMKNVGKAINVDGGMGIKNAHATFPFPIPKNGSEAMWNHLLAFQANMEDNARAYTVNANGRTVLTADFTVNIEYPYWDSKKKTSDYYIYVSQKYKGPARRSGEGLLLMDPLNRTEHQRKAWQYLPGQRRVKLAPDIGFDAPEPATSGATTFDDNALFNGSMERFNWKLIGKKEIYVPYNCYKMSNKSKVDDVLKPNHINPDFVRWELHRVWAVEATLKPGKRHVYQRRVFYLDEDCWQALLSDQYDAHGQLYRTGIAYLYANSEYPSPYLKALGHYDLLTGQYNLNGYEGESTGLEYVDQLPSKFWTPDSLAGSGVR